MIVVQNAQYRMKGLENSSLVLGIYNLLLSFYPAIKTKWLRFGKFYAFKIFVVRV